MKNRVAVLSASGIGDALLMMIVAHQLAMDGDVVTLYHDNYPLFASLFDSPVCFRKYPKDLGYFKEYDRVILQNDHSKRAFGIFTHRKALKELFVLFPKPSKMQTENDFLFDPTQSIADNLQIALRKYLKNPTKENGILPFENKGKFSKRIVIHPGSKTPLKNWHMAKFVQVADQLKAQGYDVVFTLSKDEPIPDIGQHKIERFSTLNELAQFYAESAFFIGNDSGPGHLASVVGLRTLTLSGNPKLIAKWRPGWGKNEVVTIPFTLPNFKGIGLDIRDKYWQEFISVKRVMRAFKKLEDAS